MASPPSEPRRVGIIVYDGVSSLDVTGPLEVFDTATRCVDGGSGRPYSVELVAERAGPVPTSAGVDLVAHRSFADCEPFDTVVVAGGYSALDAACDDGLTGFLRSIAGSTRRVASVCTGAFVLAGAGLLDGKRAATHWAYCETLGETFPAVEVASDPIFVRDGGIYTSAGVTAGMDLALALVEEDHGRAVALHVARCLVLYLKRPGGQSQFSPFLAEQMAEHPPLGQVLDFIAENLADDLSVPTLARRAAMSPRNFARVFAREVGTTPARHVEALRVAAARHLLEDSTRPVKTIASDCGFGSEEAMRRAFLRTVGVSPSGYRDRFQSAFGPQ